MSIYRDWRKVLGRPLRVYHAVVSDGRAPWAERRGRGTGFVSGLNELMRDWGYTVLNFATPDLPFNPYTSEIDEFIKFADVVVALEGHTLLGLGDTEQLCRKYEKPAYVFVFKDDEEAMARLSARPIGTSTWPFVQRHVIRMPSDVEDVLNDVLEMRLAARCLTRTSLPPGRIVRP